MRKFSHLTSISRLGIEEEGEKYIKEATEELDAKLSGQLSKKFRARSQWLNCARFKKKRGPLKTQIQRNKREPDSRLFYCKCSRVDS